MDLLNICLLLLLLLLQWDLSFALCLRIGYRYTNSLKCGKNGGKWRERIEEGCVHGRKKLGSGNGSVACAIKAQFVVPKFSIQNQPNVTVNIVFSLACFSPFVKLFLSLPLIRVCQRLIFNFRGMRRGRIAWQVKDDTSIIPSHFDHPIMNKFGL